MADQSTTLYISRICSIIGQPPFSSSLFGPGIIIRMQLRYTGSWFEINWSPSSFFGSRRALHLDEATANNSSSGCPSSFKFLGLKFNWSSHALKKLTDQAALCRSNLLLHHRPIPYRRYPMDSHHTRSSFFDAAEILKILEKTQACPENVGFVEHVKCFKFDLGARISKDKIRAIPIFIYTSHELLFRIY